MVRQIYQQLMKVHVHKVGWKYSFVWLLLINAWSVVNTEAQQYPLITNARPRIYLDSTRFAWLQANYTTGECGSTFTSFVNVMNNNWYNDPQLYLLGNDSSLWTWNFASTWAAPEAYYTVFIFKVNQDPLALKRCRFIINKINSRFDTLNFANYDWYTNENTIRSLADMGGMLLDWCYNDLPPSIRQQLVQNLYRVDRYFMNTYINSSAGNSYVSSHNAWNTFFANQYALVLAYADGLTPQQQDTVQQWYRTTIDKWTNGFEPCYAHYRDDDGGWNWTAAYAMWSLVDQFQFFENMRIATGKNYYNELPWVLNSINQYWHFIQPDGWTINWGDGFSNLYADRVVYLHARYFNDPRSKWLAQTYSMPPYLQQYDYTAPLYRKLMYKDFNMPVVTKPEVPTNWWSDKTGLSVSRTGWQPDAAMVWVYNAPTKKSAHEHRDNNSFCIFKNKPQIINSGYYKSYGDLHYVNYYMRTVSSNSICVFDSTEQYTNWGVAVSNDGGQNESPTLLNYSSIFTPQAQKGSWVLWGDGSNYSYSVTDAEKSYDPVKLNRFRRRILFAKPDHVLVLDHLHLLNTSTKQRDARWTLHFQNKPAVSGALVNVLVPNHVETFSGKDLTQLNGSGNVAVRTLLPLNTTTRRIGGNGYEFYVNGINYPVSGTMDTVHTTPGKWRVEVSPTAVTDSLVFFHTIKIGDNSNPAQAGGVTNSNSITTCADWDNTLYCFNSQGDTGVTYHLLNNVPGNRAVKIFATDMQKSRWFDLSIDNTILASGSTDSNGVFQTQFGLGAGNHAIAIAPRNLQGTVYYNNDYLTQLDSIQVSVYKNGILLGQTLSNNNGAFSFPVSDTGYYTLNCSTNRPWGGVNTTDALICLRHFVHLTNLEDLKLKAADVDQNNVVNTIDALMISKRYVLAINTFPSGDWCFQQKMVHIQAGLIQPVYVLGICYGDVNASFIP